MAGFRTWFVTPPHHTIRAGGPPVSELTIAGNLKDMFLNLTPASDLEFRYSTNAPTLRVDGMTVAGG